VLGHVFAAAESRTCGEKRARRSLGKTCPSTFGRAEVGQIVPKQEKPTRVHQAGPHVWNRSASRTTRVAFGCSKRAHRRSTRMNSARGPSEFVPSHLAWASRVT